MPKMLTTIGLRLEFTDMGWSVSAAHGRTNVHGTNIYREQSTLSIPDSYHPPSIVHSHFIVHQASQPRSRSHVNHSPSRQDYSSARQRAIQPCHCYDRHLRHLSPGDVGRRVCGCLEELVLEAKKAEALARGV